MNNPNFVGDDYGYFVVNSWQKNKKMHEYAKSEAKYFDICIKISTFAGS
jgi:hypothetical protein